MHQWVILDNHYYLLGKSNAGKDLAKIMQGIHGATSLDIYQKIGCGKPVWYSFWDYCPRNEKDYFVRLNYLLWNPVKHNYVDDLKEYPFSSFIEMYSKIGRESLVRQFKKFPEYRRLVISEAMDDDF